MKNLIILASLGSLGLLSADQYSYESYQYSPYQGESRGYYQDDNNQSYYQGQQYYRGNQQQYQGNQGYYQDQQKYQGNRSPNYSQDRNSNYSGYQNSGMKVISDQELRDKIRDAISSGWFSKGYQDVYFVVSNGNVTLRGSVEKVDDRKNVEDAVRKIEGVRSLENQIVTVKSEANRNASTETNRNVNADRNAYTDAQLLDSEKKYPQDSAATRDDRQLNARIRDKVSNGWFSQNYKALILRTNNGIVILSGNVDSREDVQKLLDQIKEIEGVRSVNVQLTTRNS